MNSQNHLSALHLKLNDWAKHKHENFNIFGLTIEHASVLLYKWLEQIRQTSNVFIFAGSSEEADLIYRTLKPKLNCHLYPGLEIGPYSSATQQTIELTQRLKILHLLQEKNNIIIATLEAMCLMGPDVSFLKQSFKIACGEIISPQELSKNLINSGYINTNICDEAGSFCLKGEIFDIFPTNHPPVRIHYFDELIENIYQIDPNTQLTIKSEPIEELKISPSFHLLTNKEYSLNLRENLPSAPAQFSLRNNLRNQIFEKLSNNYLFDQFEIFLPLFFKNPISALDLIDDQNDVILFFNKKNILNLFEQYLLDLENEYGQEINRDGKVIARPEQIYNKNYSKFIELKKAIDFQDVNIGLNNELNSLQFELTNNSVFFKSINSKNINTDKAEFIKSTITQLKKLHANGLKINLITKNENSTKAILDILQQNDLTLTDYDVIYGDTRQGFYYKNGNTLYLSSGDFFQHKISKTKNYSPINRDHFAEQLATLQENDYVVHKEFGVGQFKQLASMLINDKQEDFIEIHYKDGDKVFVPIYKLDLIQKYSDKDAKTIIADLKSKKFDQQKLQAKKSAKKLAFDLLELQAKRKIARGYSFSLPSELYYKFCDEFPFQETQDQLKAINDVLDDMQSETPMDRLICGDVGYGKTEIAMRAAFKAVEDKKQVVILVPTTVLAFQHYHSFVKRFENFPINIDFLSRFKSNKEVKETIEKVKLGQIDILIGTHKVLSEEINFFDLGLVIVDEEHRFGVGHKEKLKNIKSNIDYLTMTATPIPRTLQLSFMGIKDFSLINTAPPKRKSIKTFIIKFDESTIKSAIDRELERGGQIFYVHNRVQDIELIANNIQKLVPTAKIVIGHGQMGERELEKKITSFYKGEYDILLATTIIESGIDIPNANTMIVDRADTYGLAQLHQLRGRIGRSDKKAYAYFTVPHDKPIGDIASKRLHALQKFAESGAGFSIATSDLEIRGAGDILGGEQSGHIGNIGLELYMELLQEAIAELKGDVDTPKRNIEIQSSFRTFIPENYISDTSMRLKYYKMLSNAKSLNQSNDIIYELENIYGILPEPCSNLVRILQARIKLEKTAITSLKVGKKSVVINFDKNRLDQNTQFRDCLISYFITKPRLYKLNPDFSVVHTPKNQDLSFDYFCQLCEIFQNEFVAS